MSLNWGAALCAGIFAGVAATVAQVALWSILLEDALPWMLYRDARLTAAVLMGREVLPPPATLDWQVMAVATLIHFMLSIAYGLIFPSLISRLNIKRWLAAGLIYGLAIYGINMYGMTFIFPWFSEVRDWITIVAHVVFGISLACAYKKLFRHSFSFCRE